MRALLAGRKTQARLIATSPLHQCRAGDHLWVKETGTGGRKAQSGPGEVFAAPRDAEFMVFMDGWRQYRDGRGHQGAVPTSPLLEWLPAIHMPRWAARVQLVVEAVRIEPLQDITCDEAMAEGELTAALGLCWRWARPNRGVWRNPRHGFASSWNCRHGTKGERWEDNPQVVVLDFRMDR